jgi:hypothetical protein
MYLKKVICQNFLQVSSIEEYKLQFCTALLPVTFLLANFLHFSQQFRNQRKILSCFDTQIKILKILKIMFYNCVLELFFTPIYL